MLVEADVTGSEVGMMLSSAVGCVSLGRRSWFVGGGFSDGSVAASASFDAMVHQLL